MKEGFGISKNEKEAFKIALEKDFVLSDKMIFMKSADGELIQCIYYADVMKFIRELKKEFMTEESKEVIDKLAGDKLIWGS